MRILLYFGMMLVVLACRSTASESSPKILEVYEQPVSDTVLSHTIEKALPPDYDTSAWTELIRLDSTFVLDLRYATDSNFVGETMYDCGRCFLRPAAARSLVEVQDSLRKRGLGLKMFDCYRPLPVQWRLWNKVPDRRYVADPRKGSQHNKGVAVDLTIIELSTGEALDMGTGYDYFGGEAWHRATIGFKEPIRSNRELILSLMESFGWKRTNSEWWHYSYPMSRMEAPIDSMEWKCVGLGM